MKFVPIAAAHSASGAIDLDGGAAAAQRERLDRHGRAGDVAHQRRPACVRAGEAGGGVQAQHVGVAAGGRGVEVGRAPHAAVDVLAPADPHRREQPRDRARGLDRLGDGGLGRAGAAEHDPAAGAAVDGGHPQAPVEPRAGLLDAGARRFEGRRAGGADPRSRRARSSAPPGRRRPSASGAKAAPAASAQAPARRARAAAPPRPAPRPALRRPRDVSLGPTARAGAESRPPARWAATIEPAEVPTKYSHSRRSNPVASSIPASTPIIHASPSTPPPPSTSTSGGVSMRRRLPPGRRARAARTAVRDNVHLYDGTVANADPRRSAPASARCARRWTCRCVTSPSARG